MEGGDHLAGRAQREREVRGTTVAPRRGEGRVYRYAGGGYWSGMTERPPSVRPGILLGIGLGGFVDGILLHQILQWHHMVSDDVSTRTVAGLEDNTLADGIFHAVTWTITLIGSLVAVKAWRNGNVAPPWRVHVGALLAGWGIFNLLDSANHFILGLHHIRDDVGGPVGWDIGFLVFGLPQFAVGMAITRDRRVRAPLRARTRVMPGAR
jgi:uncharacterized membrane protein